jgi:pimeloyl-ACP methyl ester carboxylesterase
MPEADQVAVTERDVVIKARGVELDGILALPPSARGLVVFAHGSGSSRHSSRNRYVARRLHARGLGTLLFDLLTASEETSDRVTGHLRFDIGLLAERLAGAVGWCASHDETKALPLGLFGASTGAAAALVVASRHPEVVKAVVSRGGRPDLAGAALREVRAPTLLIVGGDDLQVLDLNLEASHAIPSIKEVRVIPGAGHLFEEPGTLEQAASAASVWFARYLIVT